MADCPRCDQWRYDSLADCVMARPTGDAMPVVWDGERLRLAFGSEAPNPRRCATGAHICFDHPMDPDVLVFGPIAEWTPLRELHALIAGWRYGASSSYTGLYG